MTPASPTPLQTRDVIAFLDAAVIAVHGPVDRAVRAVAPIAEATDEDTLVFCTRAPADALRLMRETPAGTVLCGEPQAAAGLPAGKTVIVVREPRLAFLRVVGRFFAPAPPPVGIHPSAVVDAAAKVDATAQVGALAFVGRAEIGAGTIIRSGVHVADGTRIGRRVTIHSGTVIGADGFGYHRNESGVLEKFPHIGGVVIGDDVEIGANSCIDRGALGDTIIGEGARIDNLVHIAHNVIVGRHAAVIAHAMVGGSARIGDGAWIAPSACIRDGIAIGAGAIVGMAALVVKDVPDGATVMGAPAREAAEYRALLQQLRRLAEESGAS
jgi:UDP-3-O-[3-hydroxymyristoyl] glucosamine N-acyltransferase